MDPLLEQGLKSVINSIFGQTVYTNEELAKIPGGEHARTLSLDDIFKGAAQGVRLPPSDVTGSHPIKIGLGVSTGISSAFGSDTVGPVGGLIGGLGGILSNLSGSAFNNKPDLGCSLAMCNVRDGSKSDSSTYNIRDLLRGCCLNDDDFDPNYNYDFTNIKDTGKTFTRGGRKYFRPIGSHRYALKVLGKYKNDKWLGSSGDASVGEWPVAYHGTKESNALDIVKQGFNINKCERSLYGKGIYCTPDPSTALEYGHPFDHEDKEYRLIFQVRVDPSKIKVVKEEDNNMGEYWTVANGGSIRPYGICIFPP